MTHRLLRLIVLTWILTALGQACLAQQYSVSLQFSTATPTLFTTANARAQFTVSYDVMVGLTLGGKLTLDNTPIGGQFIVWLNPNALYRFQVYGDGQLGVTGYVGANLFASYSPNVPTTPKPSEGDPGNQVEDDDGDPHPGGNPSVPTQTFGLEGMLLTGADVAYVIDDLTTLYSGLELDLRLFAQFQPVVYPYLEVDYLAIEGLTVAAGAYLSWSPGLIGYSLYANAFYNLTSEIGLRFEISFDGNLNTYLRVTYKF